MEKIGGRKFLALTMSLASFTWLMLAIPNPEPLGLAGGLSMILGVFVTGNTTSKFNKK